MVLVPFFNSIISRITVIIESNRKKLVIFICFEGEYIYQFNSKSILSVSFQMTIIIVYLQKKSMLWRPIGPTWDNASVV
jgi:hypothetical protein